MPQNILDPNKWIDRYADYLFRYTIHRINDRQIAQDIVQETFFAGLKSKDNFKGKASERTWLVSILKRKIIDHYRRINSNKGKAEVRLRRNYHIDTKNDWLEESIEAVDKNAESAIENEELGSAIQHCIEKLPPKQAQIFKMKTLQGYDTAAICNELDITASNFWVIIHRARASLAKCLKKTWF